MITINRNVDDGYGKVHTVQKETFRSLKVFFTMLSQDAKVDMNTTVSPEGLQDYLRKHRLIGKVGYWIAHNLAQTHVHMDLIGNPEGYGNKTDVWQIWDEDSLIATNEQQR